MAFKETGFIFTRFVNSIKTNYYWIECYKCIRRFYPDIMIMIIDDNSNYEYISEDYENALENCLVIKSEFPQRGEFLSYYYFYIFRPFEKAIIIHDSVFLNSPFDGVEEINDIKFLWHFDKQRTMYDELDPIIILFNYLKNKDILWSFYNDRELWNGCFGVQSIITFEFLEKLEFKYGFFNLLNCITNRSFRMALERVFAVLCTIENPKLLAESSIFGDIYTYGDFGYNFENYLDEKIQLKNQLPLIKVWTGR
jgi:hypothetical protein